MDEAVALANDAATEHLVVDTEARAGRIRNAGAVFIGAVDGAGGRRLRHRLQSHAADGRCRPRARRPAHRRLREAGLDAARSRRPGSRRSGRHRDHAGARRRASKATPDRSTCACRPRQLHPPHRGTKGSRPMTIIQGMPNLGSGPAPAPEREHRRLLAAGAGGDPRRDDGRRRHLSPTTKAAVRETAAYLGVDPDWVVLTNGLDEGLLLAAIAYLVPKAPEALVALGAPTLAPSGQAEQILMLPTFEPYMINAKALGARTIALPIGRRLRVPGRGGAVGDHRQHAADLHQHAAQPERRPVSEADDPPRRRRAPTTPSCFVDEAYHDFHGVQHAAPGARVPERDHRPHLLEGARPGRHARRRAGGAAGAARRRSAS